VGFTGLRVSAQPGGKGMIMTKTPAEPRSGATRKILVVVVLFAIAIGFYVASFLVVR
jgi:hypothetical protein